MCPGPTIQEKSFSFFSVLESKWNQSSNRVNIRSGQRQECSSEEIFSVSIAPIDTSICSHLSVVAATGQHLYCQLYLMGRGSAAGALGRAFGKKHVNVSEVPLQLQESFEASQSLDRAFGSYSGTALL